MHNAMPLSLAFRFPAGRYHATPFGHHVNEGLIEWPPSPWRLLRSLIAVGYSSGVWDGAGPPRSACKLIEKLSAELPSYHLPPAVGTHSRHYMPIGVDSKTKIEKKTLVFDTWARVEDQEMTISWSDTCLDQAESNILERLVNNLNYLGRSESWVEGRVMDESEQMPEANCFPETQGETPGQDWEQITLLAPVDVCDYKNWRDLQTDGALADLVLPAGRKPSQALLKKREKATAAYPESLLDCLQKDTNWWRVEHGWSQPPGSRNVFYWRPSDSITVGALKRRKQVRSAQPVQAMLLSLTNASRNDHALPPVTRTLPQAELLHRTLVGIATRKGTPPRELTGCDENRQPLQGPHEHTHILPLDLDDDGHLDHILIWAPMGLGDVAQAAIRSARKTFTKGGIEPLRLALAAKGDLLDFDKLSGKYGNGLARINDSSSIWQSATPFVAPRYIKARGKNALEGQIRAELSSRRLPDPVRVKQLEDNTHSQFRHFKRVRRHGPQPPIDRGFAIRLEFERPVSGPISLGYGSHFGLGLFERYVGADVPAIT